MKKCLPLTGNAALAAIAAIAEAAEVGLSSCLFWRVFANKIRSDRVFALWRTERKEHPVGRSKHGPLGMGP